MSTATKRTIRTILQLIASGALTAGVDAAAGGLKPAQAVLVLAAWTSIVTFAQNAVETKTGKTLFPDTQGAVTNVEVGGA